MIPRLSGLARCRLFLPAAVILLFGGYIGQAPAQVSLYEQTLTVASFGGAYTRSQMLAYVRPWESSTGKAVNMVDYGGGITEISSQVDSMNVKWDVVDMELSDLIAACDQGLLMQVDASLIADGADGTPADEDIPESYMRECGYPSVVWSTIMAFDKDAFPDGAPSSVGDFFNVKDYPGKRGLRRTPRGLLEWALIADGMTPSDVYAVLATPQGVEYAMEIADPLKPHIVWWSSGDEPIEMLTKGTVTMSTVWNGRIYDPIVNDNEPIGLIWDGQMVETEYWAIVAGSPRLDNARDFVRFALLTENMAEQAVHIPYGPVRKSAGAFLQDDIRPYLPTSHLESAVNVDSQFWANNIEWINTVFEEWVTPKTSEIDRVVRF